MTRTECSEQTETDRGDRHRILVVCSNGGHLAQLAPLAGWWENHERAFVTFDGEDSRSLLADERVYWAYHPTTRSLKNLVKNFFLSVRVIFKERPQLVISNGAGVAVPFFLVARLLGAKTVYIEVFDRVDSRTLTGRLCRPATNLLLLQWEEQAAVYGRGEVLGRLF